MLHLYVCTFCELSRLGYTCWQRAPISSTSTSDVVSTTEPQNQKTNEYSQVAYDRLKLRTKRALRAAAGVPNSQADTRQAHKALCALRSAP